MASDAPGVGGAGGGAGEESVDEKAVVDETGE
jgi:hypothetical protein